MGRSAPSSTRASIPTSSNRSTARASTAATSTTCARATSTSCPYCVADDGAALRDGEGPGARRAPRSARKTATRSRSVRDAAEFLGRFRHVVLYKFRPDAGKCSDAGPRVEQLPGRDRRLWPLAHVRFRHRDRRGERRDTSTPARRDFYSPAEYEKFRTHRSCLSLSRSVLNRDRTLVKQRAKVQFHVPPNTSVTVPGPLPALRHVPLERACATRRSIRSTRLSGTCANELAGSSTSFGDDVRRQGQLRFAVVADFASYDDFMQYSRHPAIASFR